MKFQKKYFLKLFLSLIVFIPFVFSEQQFKDEKGLDFLLQGEMPTLDETFEIQTASKSVEKFSEAPANIIVITKKDIEERGYTDLVEIFNDLPGIDVAVTYGDLYYRAYWRGYRKGQGQPFLFMVDGRIMNHLWFNWNDIAVAVPLSNIKHVEVIYGPASATYGPNAMMGVINVITNNDLEEDGSTSSVKLVGGSFDTRVVDINYFYKKDDFRISLTGFINHGDLDFDSLENYEYTKSKYAEDRTLWGGFLDNSGLGGGTVSSPRKVRTYTLTAYFKNIEAGVHYYRVGDMYGTNYAIDKMGYAAIWVEEDYDIYLKSDNQFNDNLSSSTMIRYRQSDVPNESNSLEGWGPYGGTRTVAFGYWQSLNSSWSAFQDFDLKVNDNLTFKLGIKYEMKNLQKAYDLVYGPALDPATANAFTYAMPETPEDAYRSDNRVTWIDEGIFLQTKYNLGNLFSSENTHLLNFGVRYDDNSAYGANSSLRAGYVARIGSLGLKVLYGEGIQEPNPRALYGAWAGQGATGDLVPEKSKTFETSVSLTKDSFSIAFNPYYVNVKDAQVSIGGAPTNAGERTMYGADILFNNFIQISESFNLKLWSYYSYIKTDEQKFDSLGNKSIKDKIGDIAENKFYLGVTGIFNKLRVTLRSRFIDDRDTHDTNPIPKVDGYTTFDLSLLYDGLFADGISLSIKVNNLTDKTYFHPGIRSADAGETPGFWANGNWYGSKGWSNSKLPQPGRAIYVGIKAKV